MTNANMIAEKLKTRAEKPARISAFAPKIKEAQKLPDGRKVEDLSAEELAEALTELKIPGASASNTRKANEACYSQHLREVYEEGGGDAVSLWMMANDDADEEKDEDDDD